MAVDIVDVFEVIDVHSDYRERFFFAMAGFEELGQGAHVKTAIIKTGQGISIGEIVGQTYKLKDYEG